MSKNERKRVYVVARDNVDYHRYIRNLDPTVYETVRVLGLMDLRGVGAPIHAEFTALSSGNSNYQAIRAHIRVTNGEGPPPVPAIEPLEQGQQINVGGTPYTVTSLDRDYEGCVQIVLSRAESRCFVEWHERTFPGQPIPNPETPIGCKCGFRAPELGPHPDCPVHGRA